MSEQVTPENAIAALRMIAREGCEDGDYGDGTCSCWPCYAESVLAGDDPDQFPTSAKLSLSDLRSAIERLADEWEKRADKWAAKPPSPVREALVELCRSCARELRSLTSESPSPDPGGSDG